MEKMLNAMLNAQKEMVLEKDAIKVNLEIISGVLEETTYVLQDLISEGKFEEAKGLLDECSNLQQEQEDFKILLANKQSDYTTLEGMIEETKRLVAKPKMCDTECKEEAASSLENVLAILAFLAME